MKTIAGAFTLLLIAATPFISSCGGSVEPEAESQRVTALLTSGTWKIDKLYIDQIESSSYPDLTLNFTATSFTAANGEPVWPSTGTWSFSDDSGETMVRNDQLNVSVSAVDANNLELQLDWSLQTVGPGRQGSVKGSHVFTFHK